MQNHPIHKNTSGFTLIELVIAVAIIGILTSVAVLGYNQYKVRAYDAHSKQALRDILLQCNAFWLDQDASQVCNHATVAEVYVASDEIVLKFPAEDLPDLPGGSQGNFCASAQHESSPNTFSIDSASLISEGGDCGGAGGSVQTVSVSPEQTFEGYKPTEVACSGKGMWIAVAPDGRYYETTWGGQTRPDGWRVCDCKLCGPSGEANNPKFMRLSTDEGVEVGEYKFVFAGLLNEESQGPWGTGGGQSWGQNWTDIREKMGCGNEKIPGSAWSSWGSVVEDTSGGNCDARYDFSTGMWISQQGHKYKNGIRVE